MPNQPTIILCRCAYAEVLPDRVVSAVFEGLSAAGARFELVDDLCELSARRDAALKRWAEASDLRIAACFPRAVRCLFAAAGAPLAPDARVLNLRTAQPEAILEELLEGIPATEPTRPSEPPPPAKLGDWIPWFPVIDADRCINCKQCLNFCLFGVFALSTDGHVEVRRPANCKTNRPACARLCPQVAIIFPKYKGGAISGDEVRAEDTASQKVQVDLSKLLRGDVYEALRRRGGSEAAGDDGQPAGKASAGGEALVSLEQLRRELDIPPDVSLRPTAPGGPCRGERGQSRCCPDGPAEPPGQAGPTGEDNECQERA